jgi:hypothetical protein
VSVVTVEDVWAGTEFAGAAPALFTIFSNAARKSTINSIGGSVVGVAGLSLGWTSPFSMSKEIGPL